jgi:hypothetical protein
MVWHSESGNVPGLHSLNQIGWEWLRHRLIRKGFTLALDVSPLGRGIRIHDTLVLLLQVVNHISI